MYVIHSPNPQLHNDIPKDTVCVSQANSSSPIYLEIRFIFIQPRSVVYEIWVFNNESQMLEHKTCIIVDTNSLCCVVVYENDFVDWNG